MKNDVYIRCPHCGEMFQVCWLRPQTVNPRYCTMCGKAIDSVKDATDHDKKYIYQLFHYKGHRAVILERSRPDALRRAQLMSSHRGWLQSEIRQLSPSCSDNFIVNVMAMEG